MRTSITISESMPPSHLKQAAQSAKRENRTMSELVREALRRYLAESARDQQLEKLKQAVDDLRKEVRTTAAGKLNMRQVEAEVKAARIERRRRQAANPAR